MLYQLSYARVPAILVMEPVTLPAGVPRDRGQEPANVADCMTSPCYRSSGSSEIAPPDDDGTGRRGSRTPMSGGGCLRSRSQTRTRFTIDRMLEVYAEAGAPSYTSMNRR